MQAAMFNGRPAIRPSNNFASKVCMKGSSKCYHVEITVNDREPEDAALRRFRRAVTSAKVVYEVRRRRTFENRQDILKRKTRERGLFKRIPDPETWTETRGTMEPSPFGDMFGEPEDIFAADAAFNRNQTSKSGLSPSWLIPHPVW
eukprot:TRINITY_DN12200_c2_g1_i2.p2 TRINITY_DN12200_c2_g1~~TRINITY_DN12200_c2_g1_i2.p2  ORF type:complete len:146 (-),score=12.40 TRINITY_DN12200_c2_g1_i2:312-749(-)